jgi:uncharacterized protein (DUF486 family)
MRRAVYQVDSGAMNPYWTTGLLLVCSNVFMTFAWYAHLKNMAISKPWVLAALASWGIALFEYLLAGARQPHRPQRRCRVGQLKIMQEVITLHGVRALLHGFYMKEKLTLDYLWAGALHPGRGVLHFPQQADVRLCPVGALGLPVWGGGHSSKFSTMLKSGHAQHASMVGQPLHCLARGSVRHPRVGHPGQRHGRALRVPHQLGGALGAGHQPGARPHRGW